MKPFTLDDAYRYILGRRAEFTILSTETKAQYTYKVRQKSDLPGIWYVYYKNVYIGYIRSDLFFPSEVRGDMVNSFAYAWKRIVARTLATSYEIRHTGTCAWCGRHLTDSESLSSGYGPVCLKKLQSATTSRETVV